MYAYLKVCGESYVFPDCGKRPVNHSVGEEIHCVSWLMCSKKQNYI